MTKVLVLLLALFAFTSAMVPREKPPTTATVASSTKPAKSPEICQPQTPCGWSMYKPSTYTIKIIDTFVTNSYCNCSADTECLIVENDKSSNTYVHRCRKHGTGLDIDVGTR